MCVRMYMAQAQTHPPHPRHFTLLRFVAAAAVSPTAVSRRAGAAGGGDGLGLGSRALHLGNAMPVPMPVPVPLLLLLAALAAVHGVVVAQAEELAAVLVVLHHRGDAALEGLGAELVVAVAVGGAVWGGGRINVNT